MADGENIMQCPHCNVTLMMADRNGIEIDYCPQCRGVWLDRGELDKIIERSQETRPSEQPARPVPNRDYRGPQDGHRDERRYDEESRRGHPRKKKESFLSDLFDF